MNKDSLNALMALQLQVDTFQTAETMYKNMIGTRNLSPNIFRSIKDNLDSTIKKRKSEIFCASYNIYSNLILSIISKENVTTIHNLSYSQFYGFLIELQKFYIVGFKNLEAPEIITLVMKYREIEKSKLMDWVKIAKQIPSDFFIKRQDEYNAYYKKKEFNNLSAAVIRNIFEEENPLLAFHYQIEIGITQKHILPIIEEVLAKCCYEDFTTKKKYLYNVLKRLKEESESVKFLIDDWDFLRIRCVFKESNVLIVSFRYYDDSITVYLENIGYPIKEIECACNAEEIENVVSENIELMRTLLEDEKTKSISNLNSKDNVHIKKEFAEDGSLISETPYVNGKKNGIEKIYFKTGKLRFEIPYIENKKNGIEKRYDKTGVIVNEASYINGEANGMDKQYDEGILIIECLMKDGQLNGIYKTYSKNGVQLSQTNYFDDKKVGVEKIYYTNGQLKSETNFFNNQKNGIQKLYNENGELVEVKKYRDDIEIEYINTDDEK